MLILIMFAVFKKSLRTMILAFVLLFLLPVGLHGAFFYAKGWEGSWRSANWSSAGILPPAAQVDDAVISVYAARVGRWRGIFAVHTWLVVKPKGHRRWERFEVVGWGRPLRRNAYAPDAYWYGNPPELVGTVTGAEAEALLPQIEAAIGRYPYRDYGQYQTWPGPNSNTFVATILRDVPDLNITLPSTAIGKDYLVDNGLWRVGDGEFVFSIKGLLALTIGKRSGIELNVLGLNAGLDFSNPGIKLPGFGRFGV